MSLLQELLEANTQGDVRALDMLTSYAKQFRDHPGKLGALLMVAIEELDFRDDEQGRELLKSIVEPVYGRYDAKAPKVSQKRRDVQRRGSDDFSTRVQARKYAKKHGRRKVVDTKGTPGDRWSVQPRTRSEEKDFIRKRQVGKQQRQSAKHAALLRATPRR